MAAHPRSRGENTATLIRADDKKGSSPLTRGKRPPPRRSHERPGLIPAHAGKTPRRGSRPRRAGAHPRSRGENFSRPKVTPLLPGSSPLTRGKPRLVGADLPRGRLIPAHAGNTEVVAVIRASSRAHPRSRGENDFGHMRGEYYVGSSPLTRGKLCCVDAHHRIAGLIPAHAGKTRSARETSPPDRAHPRSRGENHL